MLSLGHYIEIGAAKAPEDERKQVRVANAFGLVSNVLNAPFIPVLLVGWPTTGPVVLVQVYALVAWSTVTALQGLGLRTAARVLAIFAATTHIVAACALVGNVAPVWSVLATVVLVPFLIFPARQRALMIASAVGVGLAEIASWTTFANAEPGVHFDPLAADALRLTVPLALAGFPALIGVYYHVITTRTEEALAAERARSEALLLNVLPASIAKRLLAGEKPIADRFDDVTVLFSDIVGFTKVSEKTPPAELVAILDDLFSAFDIEIERRGLEKIKTIGDAYMVAGGIPTPRADHVEAIVELGLAMARVMDERTDRYGLSIRIGVHTGPVVAGVIGHRKFTYDLWGDTVNTASRMESHGVPGRVHVSAAVEERLRGRFNFEPRGTIEVKGKGPMQTFLVTKATSGNARANDT